MGEEDILRGCLKNLPHSIWGKSYFASLCPQDSELESHNKEVEAMKGKVKDMLLDSAKEFTRNIHFINLLYRLGVSYHFEDQINEHLNGIFIMLPELLERDDYDLSTLANLFQVLRQYGYNMTCDVFKKLKNENGEFKKDIYDDVEGMLCLYEACFLAVEGEDILDEALCFAKKHFEILAENSSPRLQKRIRSALMFPSHRTIERLDALNYISFYQEDESRNETLLKFAKLDYNGLQLLYRKEIAILSKWWENINVVENFPYARDRLVEAYMWGLGTAFEPQCSFARIVLVKYILLTSLMDDTYDSYGTFDELLLLTDALQRFTIDAGDELPEYMKRLYRIIYEETENNVFKGCSCKTSYVREMVRELARCYIREAKWKKEKEAPSFDEYLKVANVTGAYDIFTCAFILGMENISMKEILWVRSDPHSAVGAKLFCRLLNDLTVRTNETKRGDFPKALDCYTKQHGVSEEEAVEAIHQLLESKWRRMNEDLVKPTNMPRILVSNNFNYARLSILYYQGIDLYTYASNIKQLITSMFINPLPM